MRTILPRGSGLCLALGLVLGAPALASAQLFPNLPLHKRERPPCELENPQYRVIRQEYWGYYPTCWRKFPPGWGCPSPEAPNWQASLAKQPLKELEANAENPPTEDQGPANGGTDRMPPDRGPGGAAQPGGVEIPELPGDTNTSPFDQRPKRPTDERAPAPLPNDVPPTDPGAAPPRAPGAAPAPVGDTPATTAAPAPASRRGRMVAGLFGRKR